MLGGSVYIPSSHGAQIRVDCYVPHVSREIDPKVRRPAIVVCPGGGYRFCSEREAEPIALRFIAEGFNVFVVWYRVHESDAPGKDHDARNWYSESPDHVFPMMQYDAGAAIAYVRSHAKEQHTDPNKIAVLGFSAGGHLAASVSALWNRAELWAQIGLTPQDVRPNAAVLCYPVIVADEDAHRGSFENLTGNKSVDAHQPYSILNWVSGDFPPTFLWHTFTDPSVPVRNSLRMALALADAGVKMEMHIFPEGTHGLSLANEIIAPPDKPELIVPACQIWPQLAARFLKGL